MSKDSELIIVYDGEEIDPVDEIINYVMSTPNNTNPMILRGMLEALLADKEEEPVDEEAHSSLGR